jgi:predicted N-acetyltransferase YhbS
MMNGDIVRLGAADFEEAVDFLNLVFGTHGPHDFELLLPKLYRRDDECMGWNRAVKEGGRIRAIVGLFPLSWQVGDTQLKMGGIGGVSSHPRCRGAGYMKALMLDCVDTMRREGQHLSWLGGQRQRYGYFGYERCGVGLEYRVSKTNLRHIGAQPGTLRFVPIEEGDKAELARAKELYDARPSRATREGHDFWQICRSWQDRPHAAVDEDGDMVGYVVANSSGDHLSEVCAVDAAEAATMVRAWVGDTKAGSVVVDVPAWDLGLGRALDVFAEGAQAKTSGNWQIFDWCAVLEALLLLKGRTAPLADGEAVLEIQGYGRLRLVVRQGEGRCERTDAAAGLSCDALTAHRLLFGPLSPAQVVELPRAVWALEAWCPLPLSWARPDGV